MTQTNRLQVIEDIYSEFSKYRVPAQPALYSVCDWKALQNMNKMVRLEPNEVPLTPLGKNANEAENGADHRLELNSPIQKWEAQVIIKAIEIAKKHGYFDSKIDGIKNYYARSVRQNLLKMGREITPGAEERRMETLEEYFHDFTFEISNRELFEMALDLVIKGVYAQGSIAHLDTWPRGRVPFQSYHTSTGYPRFHNDRTMLNGVSYEEIAMRDSKTLDPRDLPGLPLTIGGRDQRSGLELDVKELENITVEYLTGKEFKPSKARVIMPSSRPGNIWVSKIIMPLIDYVKNHNSIFYGYHESSELASMMQRMSTFVHSKGYSLVNIDYSHFDTTISPQMRIAAMLVTESMLKTALGKLINQESVLWGIKAPIWYYEKGGSLKKRYRFGAIGSGENRTNFDGGLVNAIASCYAVLHADQDWLTLVNEMINQNLPPLLVMGDDCLFPIKTDRLEEILAEMADTLSDELGMTMNPTKVEQSMFLQKFTDETLEEGQYWTPFPRVVSKMFWIERSKGLGEYAWTIANWMKLWEIRFNPEFDDVVKMLVVYDRTALGTLDSQGAPQDVTKFIEMLRLEAKEVGISNKARLFDGNPNIEQVFKSDGDVSDDFIHYMYNRVKTAIGGEQPDFDNSIVEKPDLNEESIVN